MKRYDDTKRASIFGIVGNIFLFIIKIIIGLISKSQAMIADAINSGSDVFNSFMTYIGNRVASKKADDDHNMGHGKAEYIYAMLISITMILLGIKVLSDSVVLLIKGQEYRYSIWLIVVCIITIITKLFLYIYTSKVGKKHNNLLVKANSKDHRNDVFITLLTLLSVIMSYYGIKYVDAIVGMLIAMWIVYTGIMIFIESYDVLMDKTISSETKDQVLAIIDEYPEIVKVNHFNATPVGYKYMVNFSIFVDGNLSTFKSHDIADRLEKDIHRRVPEIYLTVIHVNPIEIKQDTKK